MKKSSVAIGEKGRAFIGGAVKGIDSKARTIRAYASTSAWDRYGERFAPDAFKDGLENFRKNPVILFGHDYYSPPIAKSIAEEFDSKGLILTMKFADTEKAKEVFALYEGGFMSAFSVGFKPLEIAFEERVKGSGELGAVFVKAELLENSAVPVPANPEAVVMRGIGGKTMEVSGDLLRSMLEAPYTSARLPIPAFKAEEEPAAAAKSEEDAPGVSGEASPAVEAPGASQEAPVAADPAAAAPASEPEKGFAEALKALLGMAKAARGKKVEDEAIRSLLIQTANLCREMIYGPAAEALEGGEQEFTQEEALALVKELEVLGEAVAKKGSPEDVAALLKLSKAVEKALGPISGE